jgi:glucokinase
MTTPFIPIAFPNKTSLPDGFTVLGADIGGTKTDVALFKIEKNNFNIIKEKKYHSKDWTSIADIIQDFGVTPKPNRLSISVAGPVNDGESKLTNLNWVVNIDELAEKLKIEQIYLLNDLEANAYGMAALEEKDFKIVYAGKGPSKNNAAIISPGTGLGEAGLFFNGESYHPFATEGGHKDFGPHNEMEVSLYRFLQEKYGHVSWERVVSGMGIYTIYQFLRDVMGREEPLWLKAKLTSGDPAATISMAADKSCPICLETLELFVTYLAEEAANLALQLNAKGGIFIGGGIVPKIWNEHFEEIFLASFFKVGRLKYLMEQVPVKIILNPKTAMLGAAYYGAYGAVTKTVKH